MEPGTEEYELNGDLRPGSPGSPDASVRPQHPLPRPLCDLGWRRPLWARLSSGHLWVTGPVRAASALRGGGGGRCPRPKSCLICPEHKWWGLGPAQQVGRGARRSSVLRSPCRAVPCCAALCRAHV